MGLKIGTVKKNNVAEEFEVIELTEEQLEIVDNPMLDSERVQPNITIDMNTVQYYRDILIAKENLNIPEEDIINVENTVFFERVEDPMIDIPELLDGLIYQDLDYKIGIDSTIVGCKEDLLAKQNSKYIVFLASPRENNILLAAKVMNAAYQYPGRVILALSRRNVTNVFSPEQINALSGVASLLISKGGKFFLNMEDLTNFINNN